MKALRCKLSDVKEITHLSQALPMSWMHNIWNNPRHGNADVAARKTEKAGLTAEARIQLRTVCTTDPFRHSYLWIHVIQAKMTSSCYWSRGLLAPADAVGDDDI